jgi:hypothetical protein
LDDIQAPAAARSAPAWLLHRWRRGSPAVAAAFMRCSYLTATCRTMGRLGSNRRPLACQATGRLADSLIARSARTNSDETAITAPTWQATSSLACDKMPANRRFREWARRVSNLRALACQTTALTASGHVPRRGFRRPRRRTRQRSRVAARPRLYTTKCLLIAGFYDGRGWFRTSVLSRVKRALSH